MNPTVSFNLSMFLWIVSQLILILLGLGGVAFVTLLERKLLGLSQIRLGPNKVSFLGLLQPVADGVKLLFKEMFLIKSSQSIIFVMSPILLMIMFMTMWAWILPWAGKSLLMKCSSFLFFSLLGLGAYMVVLVGWSSTSAFSKLGSMRGMLQSLSFEVALILVFLIILTQNKNLFMENSLLFQEFNLTWIPIWFILSLMETNRAPFDLLEGESELISGFNIELGSLPFVFLFLSEYGMIIILMVIMTLPCSMNGILTIAAVSFLLFMRSCYPRVRYDIMMKFMWMSLLPVSILIFICSMLLA